MDETEENKPLEHESTQTEPVVFEPGSNMDDIKPPDHNTGGSYPPEPAKPKKNMTKWLIIFALVLIGAATAWYFMIHKSNNEAPLATTTQSIVKNEIPVVRYGTQELPLNTFYPARDVSAIAADINNQIFESLVTFQNVNQIVPLLATKWTNPDSKTWVFDIRQNVKFHTDRVMTAEDVKKSIDYAVAQKDAGNFGLYNPTIASVEVLNATQVKITTKDPDPLLLNRLIGIQIFDTTSGKTNDPVNGTGAYQVKAGTTPAEKDLQLVAFDDYHQGKPLVREVHYIGFDNEDTQVAAALKGDIDITNDVSDDGLAKLDANFSRFDIAPIYVTFVGFSTMKLATPVAKLPVRQALQLSIDQANVIKVAGVRADPATQAVPSSIPGYNPDIKVPTRDLVKAKQLLTDAGYPKGVTLTYVYADIQSPYWDEIVKEAAEAGITLKGTKIEIGSAADLLTAAKTNKYDLWAYTYGSDLQDLSDVVASLFQKSTTISGGYDNPAVDKALAEANLVIDPAKRLVQLQSISKTLMDDTAIVPIRSRLYTYTVPKDWVLKEDTTTGDIGVYFWKVYQK